MTGLRIPFTGLQKQYNDLRPEILDMTDQVLRSGILMNGNWTAEFENWLAKKNCNRYAVAVGSGTAALECIAEFYANEEVSLHPPRVLIPSLTYAATANAFMRAGWEVHFIDVDGYGVMDFRSIPGNLSFQALVLVGLYGASVTHIGDVAKWRDLIFNNKIVIEDAAQHWLSADCVRIGQAAAVSFDPMKNLAAYGNGGAIVTDRSDLNHYARAWRDNGKADHVFSGTNSRMSELDCAVMMIKTQHLDRWQQRRHDIADFWLDKLYTLSKKGRVRSLINHDNLHDHALHKFVIDVDNRDIMRQTLESKQIETRIHYAQPLHEIGLFRQWDGPGLLSNATVLSRRVLSLPFYPELTDLEVEYIIDQVADAVNSSGCNNSA